MTPALEARGIVMRYGDGPPALAGVDVAVRSGELVLLMGPSGSGKTTLLSILGLLLRPTAGTVRVGGRDVTGLDERSLPEIRLRSLGFIFQGFNLFKTLTAEENVRLALELKGVKDAAAREEARALLAAVGLQAKADSLPADLSGGQKQRVAVARALAGAPDVILADEPTAALDVRSGMTVMELLGSLARDKGRAVVVVTHDERLRPLADRVIRIADGRIAEEEAVEALHL